MVKTFLFVTDTHFRADRPKLRTDDILKSQFEKLGEIITIARENDVDAILHGGDFFNSKQVPHKLVVALMDWCKQIAMPIFAIRGNHDLTGYNLDSVWNSGLGPLFEAEAIELLEKDRVWKKDKVVIKGIDCSLDFKQDYMFDTRYDDYAKIIISHNYVIPTESMPFGFVHPKDIETNADLVLCGHYHVPFEYEHGKTKWINPGPLCRWKITEKDHKPQVILITVDKGEIITKAVTLQSVKPPEKVFDLKVVEAEKKRQNDIQSFVESLERTDVTSVDIEEVIQKVATRQKIKAEVVEEILQRIRQAKEILK